MGLKDSLFTIPTVFAGNEAISAQDVQRTEIIFNADSRLPGCRIFCL